IDSMQKMYWIYRHLSTYDFRQRRPRGGPPGKGRKLTWETTCCTTRWFNSTCCSSGRWRSPFSGTACASAGGPPQPTRRPGGDRPAATSRVAGGGAPFPEPVGSGQEEHHEDVPTRHFRSGNGGVGGHGVAGKLLGRGPAGRRGLGVRPARRNVPAAPHPGQVA